MSVHKKMILIAFVTTDTINRVVADIQSHGSKLHPNPIMMIIYLVDEMSTQTISLISVIL